MIGAFFSENIVGQTIVGYLLMFAVPLALPVLFIKLVGIQGLRHLFSYEPRQTVIHQLDPRLKVVYPSLIGILTVFLNWNFVYALVAFTLIPWFLLLHLALAATRGDHDDRRASARHGLVARAIPRRQHGQRPAVPLSTHAELARHARLIGGGIAGMGRSRPGALWPR